MGYTVLLITGEELEVPSGAKVSYNIGRDYVDIEDENAKSIASIPNRSVIALYLSDKAIRKPELTKYNRVTVVHDIQGEKP